MGPCSTGLLDGFGVDIGKETDQDDLWIFDLMH